MKIRLLAMLFFLTACSQKMGTKFSLGSTCNKETYLGSESFKNSFLPMFQKQFQLNNISEECIRIYYIPSFQQEMVAEVCKGVGSLRMPDTGTVWGSMQILHLDKIGNLLSGRVANTSDSIAAIEILKLEIPDSMSTPLWNQLDSMGIWSMQSIGWADCDMVDGIGIDIHTMRGGKENYFSFSAGTYKDERYNRIRESVEAIYKEAVFELNKK